MLIINYPNVKLRFFADVIVPEQKTLSDLTHWNWNKLTTVFQTTFSNIFPSMKIVKASWYVFPTFPETSCMTVFLVPYRVARGTEIFAIFQGDDQTKIPTYMAESGVCKRQEEVSIMKHPDFWQTFIQNNGIWTWHMFLGPTLLRLYKILISHTSVSGYGGK